MIAHFVTEFSKDGTSRFVYIAEHLAQKHQVELVTSSFEHRPKKQRTNCSCSLQTKITMLPEPSYPKNVCIQRFISHAAFGKQVKRYLEARKKPDVIYCAVPSLDCAFYAAQYAQKHNVKFIIDIQDLWPEAFKMLLRLPVLGDMIFSPLKRRAKYIYSSADVIIGVSETYCNVARAVNRKNAPCIPVFLGTKLSCFDQYAAAHRVNRDSREFIIGYCGTLGHSYDIKCVLDAMRILKEKGHRDISFWLMGDGPLRDEFETYAQERGLNVTFYGNVPYEKMCGLLSACDVCVNPILGSSAASIINKHGDYAASGLPVVNTQASAEYRKLIEDYGCGINCAPSNAQELAQALVVFISDEEGRKRMGSRSRVLAEEKFDRDATYQRIFEVVCTS